MGYLWSRQVETFLGESLRASGLQLSPARREWAEPLEPMLGLDAKFLYSETRTTHMHTLKVARVRHVGARRAAISYDEVVELLGHRLDRLPPFRRRAVPVPLGLGHPVWVEDPDFDLRGMSPAAGSLEPGGDRELAAVVADVAGRPLPRDRPLWEIVVVEGWPATGSPSWPRCTTPWPTVPPRSHSC